MSRGQGTEENTSLTHFHPVQCSDPSDPPQAFNARQTPRATKPVTYTYRPPKPVSFSFKPPQIRQKVVLSPTPPSTPNQNVEQEPVFQIPNDNQTPADNNCKSNEMDIKSVAPESNEMDWKSSNAKASELDGEMSDETSGGSHSQQSDQSRETSPKKKVKLGKCNSSPITNSVSHDMNNVSHDTNNLSRDSGSTSTTPDLEVFEEDIPEECDPVEGCRDVIEIDTKIIDRFFRRGRSESVCRLITNIYDSDESGWSSDDAANVTQRENQAASRDNQVTSRDNLSTSRDNLATSRQSRPLAIRGIPNRRGRSVSSNELLPTKPRVVPTGPVVRRSTTDTLSTPAKRTAVGHVISLFGSLP